jgi:hypothetical protein
MRQDDRLKIRKTFCIKGSGHAGTWRENGDEIFKVQSSDGVVTSTGHSVLSQYNFVILDMQCNTIEY